MTALMQYFEYEHLREPMRGVSREFYELAHAMIGTVPMNEEAIAGLRKLLEAKDCFVRASLDLRDKDSHTVIGIAVEAADAGEVVEVRLT